MKNIIIKNNKIYKKMKIYKIFLITISLFFHFANVAGQGSYDVLVPSSFVPTIKYPQPKSKQQINIIDTTKIQQDVEYSTEDMVLTHKFIPEPINYPKVGKDQIARLYRNYLKVGIGYLEPYLEYSHSNLRSKKWAYGINKKHHSYFGKIKNYGPSSFSNTAVDMYGQLFLSNFTLQGNIDYSHNYFHCYGYNTDSLKKIYSIEDKHLPKSKDISRHYHTIHANINAISNYGKKSNNISQAYALDYHFLIDNNKSYEHQLGFNTNLMQAIDIARLSTAKIGGDIDLNYYHNDWTIPKLKEDSWLFQLNPKIEMTYNNYSFRVGLGLALGLHDSSTFNIYPDIEALFNVVPHILTFYVGLDGGMQRYSYLSTMRLNPFLSDYIDLGFIKDQLRIYAGNKTNISRSISFDVWGAMSLLSNMPFFFNDTASRTLLKDTSVNLFNTFTLLHSKSIHANAHASITYHYKETFKLKLNFDYHLYTADSTLGKAWYQPMFITSLDAFYNLKDKFIFTFDFYINTGAYRPSLTSAETIKAVPLKSVFDFNIGFEYHWNKRLAFFLDINNFAAQRNYFFYEYPSERINCLIGVKWIFSGEKINKK